MYNRTYTGKVKLAVLDTAGTFCDGPCDLRNRWPEDDLRGCKAPVVPFYEAFKQFGIDCSWAEIRKPMGAFKPTHLRLLFNLPEISQQWEEENTDVLGTKMTLMQYWQLSDRSCRST